MGRAMCALWGVLAWFALQALVAPFTNAVLNVGLWSGVNAHLVGALIFLTRWIASAAWIGVGGWFVVRQSGWLSRIAGKALGRPIWTVVTVVAVLYCLQYLSQPQFFAHRLTRHGRA